MAMGNDGDDRLGKLHRKLIKCLNAWVLFSHVEIDLVFNRKFSNHQSSCTSFVQDSDSESEEEDWKDQCDEMAELWSKTFF